MTSKVNGYATRWPWLNTFLPKSNTALSVDQEMRLMGATMRNGTQKLKLDEEKQRKAMNIMKKMNAERLTELIAFYQLMGKISSEVLERKLHASSVNDLNITSQWRRHKKKKKTIITMNVKICVLKYYLVLNVTWCFGEVLYYLCW